MIHVTRFLQALTRMLTSVLTVTYRLDRLMPAMDSTVITSLRTNRINPKCGLKHGLAGE